MRLIAALVVAGAVAGCLSACRSPPTEPTTARKVSLPPAAATVVATIKIGDKLKDVHAVLAPLAEEWVHDDTIMGMFRRYGFENGVELSVEFERPWDGSLVKEVWDPAPRHRFDGRFDATRSDIESAARIAQANLQAELDAGRDPFREHPINPAGRELSTKDQRVRVRVTRRDGTIIAFLAHGSGEYIKHRLIHLDLDSEVGWQHRVTVNMTDRVVVPTKWEPDEATVAALLPLARKATRAPDHAQQKAEGEYAYGPTRRLITYWFEWTAPEHPLEEGNRVSWVTLEIDSGAVHRGKWERWEFVETE